MIVNIILIFSFIVNVFLIWYIIRLVKRFLDFQEYLDEFVEKVGEYEGHVDIIHNLETFYGDPTLGNLLRHSKALTEECKELKKMYFNFEEEEEEMEDYGT